MCRFVKHKHDKGLLSKWSIQRSHLPEEVGSEDLSWLFLVPRLKTGRGSAPSGSELVLGRLQAAEGRCL